VRRRGGKCPQESKKESGESGLLEGKKKNVDFERQGGKRIIL
jgi:hypothetical protein